MSNLPVTQSEFTQDQLSLIKSTVAKGATDDELKLFLYRCKNMGLDPLKPGQVHFVKFGNNPGSIVVGIDGMRAKAVRTGKLNGIRRGVTKENGKIVSGWCEVYHKDWQHPVREEVPFSEYNTGKAQWLVKPETMIKKVAEAAALRMAFPDDVGGMYSEDETSDPKVVREVKTKELTESVQATEAKPEFEASSYFEADPEPQELGIGDTIFNVGKKNKGKKLRQIPLKELAEFVDWAKGQGELTEEAQDCADRVRQFLEENSMKEVNGPE